MTYATEGVESALFNMPTHTTSRRPAHFCVLLLLWGVLFFGSGCVDMQAKHDIAPGPAVVFSSTADCRGAFVAETAADTLQYNALEQKPDVTKAAFAVIGAPYKAGGRSPATGFDCSGLVSWSFEQVGISLPRSAREQVVFGRPVHKSELQPGDIVIFNRVRSRSGYHSGIYVGNNQFVHSPSSGKTVTRESMASAYYASRFAGARRVVGGTRVDIADFDARLREAARALRSSSGNVLTKGSQRGKKEVSGVTAGSQARNTVVKQAQQGVRPATNG